MGLVSPRRLASRQHDVASEADGEGKIGGTTEGTTVGTTQAREKEKETFADVETADLDDFLKQCDYIVNILPHTPSTIGLLGGGRLQQCRADPQRAAPPVLINVGRGSIISERDILEALDKEHISQAVLDVFVEEPLPPSSALWAHPRVIVTPHVAAVSTPEDVAEAFCANLELYLTKGGEALQGTVDFERGY